MRQLILTDEMAGNTDPSLFQFLDAVKQNINALMDGMYQLGEITKRSIKHDLHDQLK